MRKAEVTPLLASNYVARTVYDARGRVLVRQGLLLTPDLLRILSRHGVRGLWVTDRVLPDLEVREAVRHETLISARVALQRVTERLETNLPVDPAAETHLKRAVTLLVDDILENDDVVLNIAHLRAFDSYTYEHSLQVAMLSVIIGKALGLPVERLHSLAMGAILHDVGKLLIPRDILEKAGALTDDEYAVVKRHCRIGWDLVHDAFSVPPTASIVVLQHHERLDGSGYPGGLVKEHIYLYSRIVAVADVFDAMRADRVYRERCAPAHILETLKRGSGPLFDPSITSLLVAKVAIVPNGEIVRLTDGSIGRVIAQNPGFPLRPVVALVADGLGRTMPVTTLDLAADGREVATIENDWPEAVRQSLSPT